MRCVLAPVAEVLEAADGPGALGRILSERPRLVLLDVSMPGMGGLEVLESGLRLVPSLTVVMLTGQADIAVAKAALERGARAYITKPVDPQSLRDLVEDILVMNGPGGDLDRQKPWRVVD